MLLQSYHKIKVYLDSVWAPAVDVLFENRYESFRVGGEHLQFESRSVYTDSRSHRASFVLSPHTDSINLDADMRLLITRVHSHTHTNKVASAISSKHTHRHTVVWPNWFIGYYTKAHKCTTPSDFSGLISFFEKQPLPSGWNEPHTLNLKPHFTSLQFPKNPPFLETKNIYTPSCSIVLFNGIEHYTNISKTHDTVQVVNGQWHIVMSHIHRKSVSKCFGKLRNYILQKPVYTFK